MAAIINADDGAISGASGLKLSSDTSGALNIQTNGVTAIAISASQAVSFPATTSLNFASANITNLTSSTATISNTLALSGGTANGMLYLNGSNVVTSGSAVVFNGTNMGIGGTPSSWQSGRTVLQITPSSTQGHLAFGGVISNISTNAFVDSTPAWKYIANGIPALYQQDEGRHFWYTAASGTAGNTISWTQAMTLGGNGNLAIGATNTTVAKLYVVGSGNANSIMTSTAAALTGSANAVWIGDDGTDALIGPGNSGSSLSFLSRAGGVYTKAMTLDASGQLGIGTTSPGALLHVYTSTQESVRFARNSTASSAYITFYANNSSSAQVQYAGILGDVASSTAGSHGGNLLFYTTGSGTSAERARITSGGLLQVTADGTNSTFTNSGQIALKRSNDDPYISWHKDDGTRIGFFQMRSGAASSIGIEVNQPLLFLTNSAERARFTSGGTLLVGTTNDSVTAGAGTKISAGVNPRLAIVTESSTSNTAISLYSTGAAAYRFFVDPDGTIYATVTTISGISDQRLKENIRELDVGLDAIMALKPRKFDWKAGKGKDKKDDRGFIAQEFEQVFPDLIDEWKDPAPEGEEPYKSVRQDLIPVLVKAIQELKFELDQLKGRL